MPSPLPRHSSQDGLIGDLGWAFDVCVDAPLLPLLTVAFDTALSLVSVRNGDAWLLPSLFVVLVVGGWYGTQRTWFLRVFLGGSLHAREVPWVIRHHMGPFARLGSLVGIALSPVILLLLASKPAPPVPGITLLLLGIVLDVVLTFVTPVLAFRTRSARQALLDGWAMLRATWPASASYAFVPAITLTAIGQLLFPGRQVVVQVVAIAVVALVALLAKGATVAFVLRRATDEQIGVAMDVLSLLPERPDVPPGDEEA